MPFSARATDLAELDLRSVGVSSEAVEIIGNNPFCGLGSQEAWHCDSRRLRGVRTILSAGGGPLIAERDPVIHCRASAEPSASSRAASSKGLKRHSTAPS